MILSEPQAAENLTDYRDDVWLRFEIDEKITELKPNRGGTVNQEEREIITTELRRMARENSAESK